MPLAPHMAKVLFDFPGEGDRLLFWFWFWFCNQQNSFTNMIADSLAPLLRALVLVYTQEGSLGA